MKIQKVIFVKTFLVLIALLMSCYNILYSADIGEIQLAIATPDPVPAGEKVTYQIVIINRGSDKWLINELATELEIFDSEKKYLQKTGAVFNETEVPAGETTIVYVTQKVPTNYDGRYFFRIGLTYKNQKIAYSDYTPFQVTPVVVVPKVQPKIQFAGNTILSYKNSSLNNWDNSIGNISLNLLGSVYGQSLSFNMYTNHTKAQVFDLYNIIFNYYSSFLNLSIGDVMPDLSLLSLRSYGVRGLYLNTNVSIFDFSTVAVNAVPEDKSKGIYGRWFTGLGTKLNLLSNMNIGVSYIYSFDQNNPDIVSLKPPANNQVASILFAWNPRPVTFNCEVAYSGFLADINEPKNLLLDPAMRAELGLDLNWFSFNANLQQTGPSYVALASPLIIEDRQSAEVNTKLSLWNWGRFSMMYTKYIDNFKNEKDRTVG